MNGIANYTNNSNGRSCLGAEEAKRVFLADKKWNKDMWSLAGPGELPTAPGYASPSKNGTT